MWSLDYDPKYPATHRITALSRIELSGKGGTRTHSARRRLIYSQLGSQLPNSPDASNDQDSNLEPLVQLCWAPLFRGRVFLFARSIACLSSLFEGRNNNCCCDLQIFLFPFGNIRPFFRPHGRSGSRFCLLVFPFGNKWGGRCSNPHLRLFRPALLRFSYHPR